jgi:CDP-6-deoxy-D-xylo-4-hexulose-3-dehydrase
MSVEIGSVCLAHVARGNDRKEPPVYMLVLQNQGDGEFLCIPLTKDESSISPDDLALDENSIDTGKLEKAFTRIKKGCLLHNDSLGEVVAQLEKNTLERVLRAYIQFHVSRYYHTVHAPRFQKPFVPGTSAVQYGGRIYDDREFAYLIDASLEFYLTGSRYDAEFCSRLEKKLNSFDMPPVRALTVNSGSSANLLAIAALTSPKLKELGLQEGDEVITVAAGFPTTVTPLLQNHLIPVFIDIDLLSCNIDTTRIEEAITPRTRAIFLAHTLGIPFDLDGVLALAEKYNLWVIEDNCDALLACYTLKRKYRLIKDRVIGAKGFTGTIGHIGTSSFYPAHQITMGEGGALYTADQDLYRIALSFRDWGRDCWCSTGRDNTCRNRFGWKLSHLPIGYDHKYTYSHLGYNLKITEMQAAIGVAQLDKLQRFANARFENWKRMREGLTDLVDVFILPKYPENTIPSPFGFALTVRKNAGFSRNDLTGFLEAHKIQTRTVFAGNILRQPALTERPCRIRIGNSPILFSHELNENWYGRLPNTETVMANTFWTGVYPGLDSRMLDYIIEKIHAFVKQPKHREKQ